MKRRVLLEVQYISSDNAPSAQQFGKWAELAAAAPFNQHNDEQELTIRIVDDNESQTLNRTYRNKDKPTNVLSFAYEQTPEFHVPLLGDLVICAPVVIHEANVQGKQVETHWAHMTIHGVLHLLGYDHIQQQDAEKMEQLEVTLMEKLGYAN
ncbi:MAG: rRNA maturation RNase YbeY, partial [Gammaproteobacteria bacterium]|nr:rRNA maturation RNase YbeY [Gammaproteobacteria bacterium]